MHFGEAMFFTISIGYCHFSVLELHEHFWVFKRARNQGGVQGASSGGSQKLHPLKKFKRDWKKCNNSQKWRCTLEEQFSLRLQLEIAIGPFWSFMDSFELSGELEIKEASRELHRETPAGQIWRGRSGVTEKHSGILKNEEAFRRSNLLYDLN